MDGAGDIDQTDFEEALGGLGMLLTDGEMAALYASILVPPADLINADDFAAAVDANPPS